MAYRQKDYTYNNSLSKEENLLLDRLYKLKLSHMAEELERQFLNPNTELEDFHTRISAIINYEWDQRQTKKFNRLKTKATLKYPNVDFDQSLYEPDRLLDTHTIELLQKCDWIDEPKTCLLPVARVLARHISQTPYALLHSTSSGQSNISGQTVSFRRVKKPGVKAGLMITLMKWQRTISS